MVLDRVIEHTISTKNLSLGDVWVLKTPPSGEILLPWCFSIHFDVFSHTNFNPRGPWVNVDRFGSNLDQMLSVSYGTSGLVTRSILENFPKSLSP